VIPTFIENIVINNRNRNPEWFTIKLFRGLISVYTKCSYIISNPYPQTIFTLESIISLLVLGGFFIAAGFDGLSLRLTILGTLTSLVQMGVQLYGLNIYFKKGQPNKYLIAGFVASCFSTILISFYSAISLYAKGKLFQANMITLSFWLNTVLLYYTLWQVILAIVGIVYAIEAIIRLFTGKLSKPYNTDILLPFLYYPRIPNQFREPAKIDIMKYSSSVHGEVPECILCLENFENGQQITVLQCHKTHLFHVDCLQLWKMKSDTCPMCRTKIIEFYEIK